MVETMTLDELVIVMSGILVEINPAIHAGLSEAGNLIEKSAKGKIGTGQDGWAELADSTITEKSRLGYGVPNPLLRTGDLRESITHTVHGHESVEVGSPLDRADWMEHGTPTIPPRPFLATAAMQDLDEAGTLIVEQVMRVLSGEPIKAAGP